jgi:hypothetical protein
MMTQQDQRITYEAFDFATQTMVSDNLAKRIKHDKVYEPAYRATMHQFSLRVFGRKLHRVTYPTTWLDAFKERWTPAWLLKRRDTLPWWLRRHLYPSYTTITSVAFYPDLLPKEYGSTLDVVVSKPEDWYNYVIGTSK